MGSRMKEDEKNEKIIRGLMKLPHNRRCINCNSLGPQYVCTNFWTFVCTTCSGIHREFTHRVKSVSMAKFTVQEVAALQGGGNKQAREIYFTDWDPQRNPLPDCSNIDRLRDFIKNVYVDKRYAGGRAGDRPPKGKLGDRDEIYENRRPDSYHSDSRSPPYDDRYDERRYERPGSGSWKVESDRGRYDDKTSRYGHDERKTPGQYGSERGRNDRGYYDNFQHDGNYKRSPGHFEVDQSRYEDKFANEGPDRRFEDRSVLDSRDRWRLNDSSPNYQRNFDLASPPPVRPVRDILGDDVPTLRVGDFPQANGYRDTDGSARSHRTASSSSIGSFDGNSQSLKGVSTDSLIDFNSVPERPVGTIQQDPFAVLSFPQPSTGSAATVQQDPCALSSLTQPSSGRDATSQQDPFAVSSVAQPSTGPCATGQQDLFAVSSIPKSSMGPLGTLQEDPFAVNSFLQPSATPSLGNTGWAKFDFSHQGSQVPAPAPVIATEGPSTGIHDAFGHANNSGQWAGQWLPVQQVNAPKPVVSAADNLAAVSLPVQPVITISSSQLWNAFPPSPTPVTSTAQQNMQTEKTAQKEGLHTSQTAAQQEMPSATSTEDKRKEIPEDLFKPAYPEPVLAGMGLQWGSQLVGPASGLQFASSGMYQPAPMASYIQHSKSTNPFDLPGDPPAASNSVFPSMGSLQAALPTAVSTPGSFLGGPNSVWQLSQPPTTYTPTPISGRYIGQQAANSLPQIMQCGATPAIGSISTATFPGDNLFGNLGGQQLPSQSSLSSFGSNPFV